MTGSYCPERGDIVWTDFDPAAGHEQACKRPALVLSPEIFNSQVKLALVAPITSTVRGHGFEVELTGGTTTGVVLCQQVKVIDYVERGISFVEIADSRVTSQVLEKVKLLVS